MDYRRLFIFVEGRDDELFFERILSPILQDRYDHVLLWTYRQETKKKTNEFLRSILSMNAHYIFVSDIDDSPCVTMKKERIISAFQLLESNNILVVKREIESWYLAGLDDECCEEIGISQNHENTDVLSKENFNNLIPRKFGSSRIDFMQEVLKFFRTEIAHQKNTSFQYFIRKYCS